MSYLYFFHLFPILIITNGWLYRPIILLLILLKVSAMPNGSALAKSAIATSHRYKSQTGEQKEEVWYCSHG